MKQVTTVADLHARVKRVLQSGYPCAETSETGDRRCTKHGWNEQCCVCTYTNDVNKKNGLQLKNFKISRHDVLYEYRCVFYYAEICRWSCDWMLKDIYDSRQKLNYIWK